MTTTAVIEHFDVFEHVRSGGAGSTPAAGPHQRIRHKVRRHERLDGPAYDFPIEQIQYDREIQPSLGRSRCSDVRANTGFCAAGGRANLSTSNTFRNCYSFATQVPPPAQRRGGPSTVSTQRFDHCLHAPNVSLAAFELERFTVGQLYALTTPAVALVEVSG
ncbi:protein of unknown function (plasmid) [Cupriavidus taiwanensis]|uniref:Uncharacterized protein n=1 Tax=Cupriavidus taiwanensis TaxID=164546 RepID=A0A375ISA7_9BURK|nr:protein of unknown function [Cupriavidus taiwanensis]